VSVTVEVRNVGSRAGKAVPQLYSTSPEAAGHPPLSLRAFGTAVLEPGAMSRFTLEVPIDDLAAHDETGRLRTLHPGEYRFSLGLSSRDLRATTTVLLG
jgi:beta-glucosidase